MNKKVIYILTNPSFPQFVKIGYADDVIDRVDRLNSNPGLPYSFRIYATYEVNERLDDLKLHKMIDALNPTLRTKEEIDGKQRKREFFAMSAEVAYNIFEAMAEISGTRNRLHLWKADEKQKAEEEDAEEVRELNINRHRFKEITFCSSLTGKTYYSKTNPDGSLGIFEKDTNEEVVSFSNPSKKQIVRTALIDLGFEGDNTKTLYQLMHQLEKAVLK
ncbi:MAG: GIY-YIG nuclease family protein [Candidatus Cloacimonetes bacterium]|nr:GIY-YIG nuclease family protein [Candidatus Cloacimonadota bacterium]